MNHNTYQKNVALCSFFIWMTTKNFPEKILLVNNMAIFIIQKIIGRIQSNYPLTEMWMIVVKSRISSVNFFKIKCSFLKNDVAYPVHKPPIDNEIC